MLFPTVAFAVFFVIAFVTNWLLRPHYRSWRLAMTVLSVYFYFRSPDRTNIADFVPWLPFEGSAFVLLLALSVGFNWLMAHAVHDRLGPGGTKTPASRSVVAFAVTANLLLLGYFKYWEFFRSGVADFLDVIPGLSVDLPTLDIVLPIGISFFTFHTISYVVDVGRGSIRPMGLGDFALYISFFPHLVAGPIVRASELGPQLRRRPDPRRINSAEAFRLILSGLFKKVVISSILASAIVDEVFRVPSDHSAWENLWAVYGYAIQIYADFSGYTDIAIGCALLLGFRFPQNFDSPYRSLSVQDFWRRWHMTLSRWLRDYLYIPLGGNRKGTRRTYINLIATMVLGGLWHGAAWTFLIWGLIHGLTLAAERWIKERWQPIGLPRPAVSALQWLLTFHIVCLAWIFFRAEDLGLAFEMLGRIFSFAGGVPPSLVTGLVAGIVVVMIALQFVPQAAVIRAQDTFSRLGLAWQGIALGAGLTVIATLAPVGVAPFIYFQF